MRVGPVTTNFALTTLQETVTPGANYCPASVQSATAFPFFQSPFTVGNTAKWEGANYPAIVNDFYDSHIFKSAANVLAGIGGTCNSYATQTYTCNGNVVGTFNLTATFTAGFISSTPVTYVTVTKQ